MLKLNLSHPSKTIQLTSLYQLIWYFSNAGGGIYIERRGRGVVAFAKCESLNLALIELNVQGNIWG